MARRERRERQNNRKNRNRSKCIGEERDLWEEDDEENKLLIDVLLENNPANCLPESKLPEERKEGNDEEER